MDKELASDGMDKELASDGMDKELASVAYTSVDEVAGRVTSLGRGAELVKADVKAAYRNVPVHPRDRWLLGMRIQWIAIKKGAGWLRPRRRLCVGRRHRIRRMCTIYASVQRYM